MLTRTVRCAEGRGGYWGESCGRKQSNTVVTALADEREIEGGGMSYVGEVE